MPSPHVVATTAPSPTAHVVEDVDANVPLVFSYTREQAVDDGVLIDVTETAHEAGFKVPTVVTKAVWDEYVEWSEADNQRLETCQDKNGRLWDVVWMAAFGMRAAAKRDPAAETTLFQLLSTPRDGPAEAVEKTLKVMVHPGDKGEPVATILLPNED